MHEHNVMLITGASRSIGEYLAGYYLDMGYQVIGCSRQVSALNHENYRHYILDVRDEEKVKQMFMEISKNYGRLSILINNAGMQTINHSLLTDHKTVQDVFSTNMFGAFLFCRESAKLMKKNNYGRIVNMSSIAVPLASVGSSIYSSSKAALEQFSRVFAKEVASYGIRVNVLGLSVVHESGMIKNISEGARKQTLDQTILKEPISFKDVSHALDFLIAQQSNAVTAQALYLGGV